MKKISILGLSALLALSLQADTMGMKKEGVKYIKMLGKELKTNLKAHMKADPSGLEAMGFCAGKAQEITQAVNAKLPKGATVRRTALKLRSPANAADIIDKDMMQSYQKKADAKTLDGKDIQMAEVDGKMRVYKPLLIQPVCMKCHGDSAKVSDDIQAVLTKVYPSDNAMGFNVGDFRGVMVSEFPKR